MIGHEGGHHGHLPLGKIDHFGGLINDDHRNAEQAVAGPDGQSFNNQLSNHVRFIRSFGLFRLFRLVFGFYGLLR